MLMAVLMIVSLVPAVSADTDVHAHHDKFSYSVAKDVAAKQAGIELVVCNDDGAVVKATVVPFAEKADIQKCAATGHNWKGVELQKASCEKVGITLTYCVDCGTAKVVDKDGSAAGSVVVDTTKLDKHVYSDFKVVVEPTCNKEGWGYVVCDNCKNPVFVAGVKEAIELAEINEDVTNAKLNEVSALYQAANLNHYDKDAFVAVTEDVYDNGVRVLRAPVKATHDYATVGGLDAAIYYYTIKMVGDTAKIVKVVPSARGTVEYTGDKYCPDCFAAGEDLVDGDNYVSGTEKGSLWVQHKLAGAFTLAESDKGYYPYVDADGTKHDGKTDRIYCSICKTYFGGDVLPYDEYVDLTKVTEVGQTWTDPAVAPTCCAEGKTATVWTYSKATASADAAWVITTASKTVDKLAHNFVPATDKAATCTKDGVKYYNYYVCTNVCGSYLYDDCECCDHDAGYQCQATKGSDAQYEVIPAAHKYEVKTLVAATCTTNGLAVKCCSVCGDYAVDEQTNKPVTIEVLAVPCTAGDPVGVKEATCTEVGYTGDTFCQWCGKAMTTGKEIPMVDHTVVDVEAVAATCTEAGLTAGTKCSVCDKVLSGCEVVDALGHSYAEGVCTVCGAEDPDYVAPVVTPEFTDADAISEWAGKAVAWAAANGVVEGREDGSFDPQADVTRAEVAVMLYRLAGEPEVADTALAFADAADVPEWAVKAVAWAVSEGVVNGYTDNTFKANANITRAEFVQMLFNMKGAKVESAATFSDVVAGEWYVDAINWAVENDVTEGMGDGSFGVAANCSREQAVTFLFRLFAE